jgi:Domain of Unknown Function with PDB structure (DUF3857)
VSYRRLLVLVLVLFLGAVVRRTQPVSAGDEWQPISQEELKMTSVPEAPGAPAIYLYRQVDRNDMGVQRGRGATEYNYVRIKILTEEGRKHANIEIPFERQRTNLSNIRARTVRPDGTIANFDGKVYEQTLEKTKGVKYLAKTFTLPDVQVGSIIEYHYNVDLEDYYIFRSYWILSEELFTKRAVFSLKPYDRPPWTVQWSWPAGLPKGTEPPKEGPDRIVRMSTENVPAFVIEDHMPPLNELKYRVVFTYHDEIPELNVDKYWKQFDKKKNGQVEGFIDKRKAMEEAVAGIISPGDAPEEKLRKIYARVQQIQNLTYLPRKTVEERKHEEIKENNNVEDLWKHQYGTGWDLTWLFLALVRASGMEAYPCLVSGRSEYFFRKERVDGRELDANVVLVKVNGKEEFFDPGAAFTPFGMLPWMETATIGLKLDKDGGSWIQTPLPESSVSRVERKADMKLTDDGSLEGKVTVTYTGLEAYALRMEERNEDDTARQKLLEDRMKEQVPAAIDLELKKQPDWKNANEPFVVEYEVKVSGWVSGAGKRALLPVGLFSETEKHMFEHASRVFPVYFAFPFQKIDEVNVELPLGWQVGSVPKPVDQDAKAVQYTLKAEGNNSSLHFKRALRSDLFMVPAEQYSALRTFYQLVRSGDEQQIVLQPGTASSDK